MKVNPLKESPKSFQRFVAQIEGLVCWHVTAGGFAPHSFSLELGTRHKRRIPIPLRFGREEIGVFEGDASLLVACFWRLEREGSIVATSDSRAGEIAASLDQLKGTRIAKAEVAGPGCDLMINTTGGRLLRILTEHCGDSPSFDLNWQLRIGERRMVVGLSETLIRKRKIS